MMMPPHSQHRHDWVRRRGYRGLWCRVCGKRKEGT